MPVPAIPGVPPMASFAELLQAVTKIRGELVNLLLNLDSLNVVELTADHITAGTIDAGVVTIRTDLNTGAYIQIDNTGMTVNNGSFDVFTVDINGNVTMTSAAIQSATGYPKVTMDPTGNLFGAYLDGDNYFEIQPSDPGTGAPTLYWVSDGSVAAQLFADSTGVTIKAIGRELNFSTEVQGNINIIPVAGFSAVLPSLFSTQLADTGQSLQSSFDEKADGSGINGTVYVATSSGGPATTPITFANGIRVS